MRSTVTTGSMVRLRAFLQIPLMLIALCGCVTQVSPPAHPSDPVTIYVADYGRHASIVLPTTRNTLTEYSYGDWRFYALGHNDVLSGIGALFCSEQAAMGRRRVTALATTQALVSALGCESVLPLRVDGPAAVKLVGELDARYSLHEDGQLYNRVYFTYFVKDAEEYGLFNNSNMMTARWLREAGCRTYGWALLSKFEKRGS